MDYAVKKRKLYIFRSTPDDLPKIYNFSKFLLSLMGLLWSKKNLLFWAIFSEHTCNRQLYNPTFQPQIIFYRISQYSCPTISNFIIRQCNSSKAMHTIQIWSPVTQTFLPSFFMSLCSLKLNLKDIISQFGRDKCNFTH